MSTSETHLLSYESHNSDIQEVRISCIVYVLSVQQKMRYEAATVPWDANEQFYSLFLTQEVRILQRKSMCLRVDTIFVIATFRNVNVDVTLLASRVCLNGHLNCNF